MASPPTALSSSEASAAGADRGLGSPDDCPTPTARRQWASSGCDREAPEDPVHLRQPHRPSRRRRDDPCHDLDPMVCRLDEERPVRVLTSGAVRGFTAEPRTDEEAREPRAVRPAHEGREGRPVGDPLRAELDEGLSYERGGRVVDDPHGLARGPRCELRRDHLSGDPPGRRIGEREADTVVRQRAPLLGFARGARLISRSRSRGRPHKLPQSTRRSDLAFASPHRFPQKDAGKPRLAPVRALYAPHQ